MRRHTALISLLTLAVSISILSHGKPAIAAKKIVFRYGIFEESIRVEELKDFAENGRLPSGFAQYIRRARLSSDSIRNTLKQEIPIFDFKLLDQALNMLLGEIALDKLGEAIYTPTKSANRQALRAALILAAKDDAAISLLEVLEGYPTQEIYVDISRLSSAFSEFNETINPQRLIDLIQSF